MSDTKYPERGKVSEDGKFYTHVDGSVHENTHDFGGDNVCAVCSLNDHSDTTTCFVDCNLAGGSAFWRKIEGAYVPSPEEREAYEAMREMIGECSGRQKFIDIPFHKDINLHGCATCNMFPDKSCPARLYLSKHGDEKAWSVTP